MNPVFANLPMLRRGDGPTMNQLKPTAGICPPYETPVVRAKAPEGFIAELTLRRQRRLVPNVGAIVGSAVGCAHGPWPWPCLEAVGGGLLVGLQVVDRVRRLGP